MGKREGRRRLTRKEKIKREREKAKAQRSGARDRKALGEISPQAKDLARAYARVMEMADRRKINESNIV